MKRSFSLLLAIIALVTVATFAARKSSTPPEDQSARISRIENGLLPAVIIKDQAAPPVSVAARMEHYKVSGVSVAYFESGKLAWTRTHGFADVAAKRPVTRKLSSKPPPSASLLPHSQCSGSCKTASSCSMKMSM